MMKSAWCLFLSLLALGLPAATLAQTEPPLTHDQALQELDRPYAESRRSAVKRLGEIGLMSDTPALIKRLRDADRLTRGLAENALWQVWTRSGDEKVDALFRLGVEQMQEGPGHEAIATFSKIIELKPDFAEGWNKRATLYFIMGKYRKSLADCGEVLKRNPHHFGALAGYGQIYLRLNRPELALDYFRRALDINPNLRGVEI
ncbi:MAG TPA: tetratricopeptide repeat protein, partial [Burkholderiales bacterium]|nr:tetratricopeptide repeat protein [Burkholderiales bacterium]